MSLVDRCETEGTEGVRYLLLDEWDRDGGRYLARARHELA